MLSLRHTVGAYAIIVAHHHKCNSDIDVADDEGIANGWVVAWPCFGAGESLWGERLIRVILIVIANVVVDD
jgi:hypothetical protein